MKIIRSIYFVFSKHYQDQVKNEIDDGLKNLKAGIKDVNELIDVLDKALAYIINSSNEHTGDRL